MTVSVPDFVTVSALEDALDMDRRQLRLWNPALSEAVWSGDKFVPRGFELRLPAGLGADPAVRLAAIPATSRYTAQMADIYHRVGRGDTISQIAERYGVSVASLVELNGLRSRNFIRAGQVLRLPGNGGATPVTLAEHGTATAGAASTYIVRAGDSLNRIARKLGVSEEALLARNGIANRNLIFAGQELYVDAVPEEVTEPAAETATAAASVPAQLTPVSFEQPVAVAEPEVAAVMPPATRALAEEQRLLASEAALAMIAATGVEPEPVLELENAAFGTADSVGADEEKAARVALSGEARSADETIPETNALGSEQAELAADPSDYLVASDDTIEVQALETLGHYADWLRIPTQRLRDINGLPFGQAVVIGERLKLEFSASDVSAFEQRRTAYQRNTQEAFFRAYQIADTIDHVIRPGESLWVLAQRRYRVPVWLVRQFNPDLDLDQIKPGTVVKFPSLAPIADPKPATQAAN